MCETDESDERSVNIVLIREDESQAGQLLSPYYPYFVILNELYTDGATHTTGFVFMFSAFMFFFFNVSFF